MISIKYRVTTHYARFYHKHGRMIRMKKQSKHGTGGRDRMSRESETIRTIKETMEMMTGDVKKAPLYLLPILSQIALSLAVIADCMTEGRDG